MGNSNAKSRDISIKDDFKRYKSYGKCKVCKRYNTNVAWCQLCDPKKLLKEFEDAGADELRDKFWTWNEINKQIKRQFDESDKKQDEEDEANDSELQIHPEAVYTCRIMDFGNLNETGVVEEENEEENEENEEENAYEK
ncbi:10661_t:CDS:2 [Racocetra persica]|uniref:10661_t:CDS:1 n=1 Tax=Racocetra persica TaxID=160502 RepID=A0ACA9QE42_9GLOM|nr:10661_t:CDS:2 [Racocetra persica]